MLYDLVVCTMRKSLQRGGAVMMMLMAAVRLCQGWGWDGGEGREATGDGGDCCLREVGKCWLDWGVSLTLLSVVREDCLIGVLWAEIKEGS